MRNLYRLFSCLLLLILLGGMTSFSQSLDPPENQMQAGYYLCEDDLIEIMFIESSRVRLRNDQPTDLISDATLGVDVQLSSLQWHSWSRFSEVDETLIDRWAEDGELNTGQKLYNLNNIFRLQIPKGHDIWEISKNLEALPGIYLARPVPKPMPLPLPGNYQSQQGYLNSASSTPTGIDALWSWTQTGGTGSGITVCDLEYSWNYNHADITKAIGSQINLNVVDPFSDNNHGTAVIGMLVADNNGWGVTGICYGANLKTCGTYYGSPSPVWNVPGAIALAIANLSPGDIILLEQQWDYTGSGDYIPIEWWLNYSPGPQTNNGVYSAIQTAVANGIHVVQAGGNGEVNTGMLNWYGNSGAIIVGAGTASSGNDLQRITSAYSGSWGTSYGQRFDLQGWGENVMTTGYGTYYSAMGPNYYYRADFRGTSSAAPCVAGAIACAQGYYVANISGTPMSPINMRNLLVSFGTPQVFGPTGNIGPRPDLFLAITNIPPPSNDLDFGDAPDGPYPTLLTNNGARHVINPDVYLGYLIDAEPDGQPTPLADGDDLNNLADEDGVAFLWPVAAGNPCKVKVTASVDDAYLNAWFDFNQNGSWADPEDHIFINVPLNSGDNLLNFIAPAAPVTVPGLTFARFRFSHDQNLSFTGLATDGEVEDYGVDVEEYGDIKWRQLPNEEWSGLHCHDYWSGSTYVWITGADDWLCAGGMVTDIHWWGNYELDVDGNEIRGPGVDHFHLSIHDNDLINCVPLDPPLWETDVPFNQVNETWTGLVNNEGCNIYFYEYYLPDPFPQMEGNRYWLDISAVSVEGAMAPNAVWRWQEADRGPNPILCGATSRVNVDPWFIPGGPTYHDMAFVITSEIFTDDLDFGDAPDGPYPTLSATNGARHVIVPGMHLGASVDPEPDGQPDSFAMGDDMNGIDDEDGVIFVNSFVRAQNVNLQVSVAGSGYINAWFDWNTNGSWAEAGEHAIVDWFVNTGVHSYTLTVPAGATPGFTFSRFRFSSIQNPGFDGSAPDGEVEDYRILINEPEDHKMHYPQYPDPGGWDVNFSFPHRIGDDWMCTETGLVEDFHFWVSWKGDMVPEDFGVTFQVQIFSDIPADPDNPLSYSRPGTLLWDRDFAPDMYIYEWVFEHPQGWYDPFIPEHQIWDHNHCYRIDIEDFPEPFMQEEGTIYWLVITAVVPGGGGIVYEDVILTLDNIDPTTPAYQTWMEDLAVLSIQDHPAYPPASFSILQDAIILSPAMLVVDLSAYSGTISWVEVDVTEAHAPGNVVANLYDAGTLVDSKASLTGGFQTLVLTNTGLANHPDLLTVEALEGIVHEIRFELELSGGDEYKIGWKTSPDHFQDVAVRESPDPDIAWEILHDPVTGEPLSLSFIITGNPPDLLFDYGDAPEDALAYPATGVIGQFPTCMNVGPVGSFIQHNNFGAFFGPSIDFEPDGNAGFCPTFNPNMYDQDECFNDGDAGLLVPDAYTITGSPGSEIIVPCSGAVGVPLGLACTQAIWGSNIDIHVQNLMPGNTMGYVNVIFDWDQSGHWGGVPICPGGINAPEHVLVNFPVPNGFVGPLSMLTPPAFLIGPHTGHVWVRFSITDVPVPLPWDGSGIFEDGETEDYLLLVESEIPPEPFEFGDAPEGALAYPASGVTGQFPTCIIIGPPGSYIQHMIPAAFFGPSVDLEPDGNAGFCPTFNPNLYDQDECFGDGDAGLIIPGAYTIVGSPGSEVVVTCPTSPGGSVGNICSLAIWGTDIELHVTNNLPSGLFAYVNIWFDWNQDGLWGGASTCPAGFIVSEHVMSNFVVPNGYSGPLSALTSFSDDFLIGPNSGYVWARFTITEPTPGVNYSGIYDYGETEDYLLHVLPTEDVNLQNITLPSGTNICFDAANTITTAGGGTTFIVQNGAIVYLVAGNSIQMLPGTHFQSGSYVHAYIDQTGEFCSNPKAIIAEEEPVPEVLPFEFTDSDSFFRVYPNPTRGQFTLELRDVTETSTIKVEIFSLVGESIMNVELPEMKQYLFDLSAKQPGIYLIRVMRGDKVGVQKVIRR